MKRCNTGQRGFTIIEVMLFLAITGLMMAGVLAAVTGGIDRQRYQDANASLNDFIQGQYNLVDNVRSNRSSAIGCTVSGGIDQTGATPQHPGTSDCTVIGRYITSENGETINSRPIYATADITGLPISSSEADLMNQLKLVIPPDDVTADDISYDIAWATYVYTSKTATSRGDGDFSLVLIKLPTSGLVRTFAVEQAGQSVAEVINGAIDHPLLLCVATDGLVGSPPTGVKILNTAVNSSGVQPITASSGECS